jgi:hypothetical protein
VFSRPVLIGRGLEFFFDARARYGVLKGMRTDRFPVAMAAGIHPFPSRTRPLSPPAPMVLGGRPPGRVGRCRNLSFDWCPSIPVDGHQRVVGEFGAAHSHSGFHESPRGRLPGPRIGTPTGLALEAVPAPDNNDNSDDKEQQDLT